MHLEKTVSGSLQLEANATQDVVLHGRMLVTTIRRGFHLIHRSIHSTNSTNEQRRHKSACFGRTP